MKSKILLILPWLVAYIYVKENSKFQLEVRANKERSFPYSNPRTLWILFAAWQNIDYIPNVNVDLLNWKEAHNISVMREKKVIKQYVQYDPIFVN